MRRGVVWQGWGDGFTAFFFLSFFFVLFFKDLDHVIGNGKAAAHLPLWYEALVQAWTGFISSSNPIGQPG
jgi:hypothetical protein